MTPSLGQLTLLMHLDHLFFFFLSFWFFWIFLILLGSFFIPFGFWFPALDGRSPPSRQLKWRLPKRQIPGKSEFFIEKSALAGATWYSVCTTVDMCEWEREKEWQQNILKAGRAERISSQAAPLLFYCKF